MDTNTPRKKGRFNVHFRPEKTINKVSDEIKEEPVTIKDAEKDEKTENTDKSESLFLYHEDMKSTPRTVTFLDSFQRVENEWTSKDNTLSIYSDSNKKLQKQKLGTLLGVYLPTIQHILGLLMFIRHSWIVGHSGLIESILMVFMCCLTTFFTAISVSAIATNGILPSGGSYYVLSRNLGPECGGSIGVCFYLANTFATCMYLLGSIELFLVYMAPQLAIFGDIHLDPWNNFRVYGTCLLFLLTLVVALGVKIVSIFAPISLICVIISILSIIVGAFASHPDYKDVKVCLVGDKLYSHPSRWGHSDGHMNISDHWCSKNESSLLYHKLCEEINGSTICDPYFMESDVRYVPAIPGITSGIVKDNLFSHYMEKGEVSQGIVGNKANGEVTSDMTTNFIVLCAIYFPSVTGILTGVNMSGDLKNAQKSIPKGTILAQLTSSFVYLLFIVLFGTTVRGEVLRDKFGESLGGELLSALLCWPNKWVVLVGAFASSIGAGLQCLVSAPRLLQAIAVDDIIPFLSIFKTVTKRGEPIRALILTFFIAEIGIIIANIDTVAPIIDVFFLMCYLFVNLICVLQTILKLPNWRPRFKYYHWTLSLIGVFLNFALCIIAGWYYALSAFLIAAFIFMYIQYKGGEKEWGDGITGLLMSITERGLLGLSDDTHMKNWRPQILVLEKINPETHTPANPELLQFVAQLKHGRGLTLISSVVEGDPLVNTEEVERVKLYLKNELAEQKIRGFVRVVSCNSLDEGLSLLIQGLGLGSLTHNTVMLAWPELKTHEEHHKLINLVKVVRNQNLALMILKCSNFPQKNDRLTGTIDIWWIIHDGGMLILLSFLLKQHKVWKGCKIRIFTVAHVGDNSVQIKTQLQSYLYEIRIQAEVFVEEMFDSDISAYEVERTLDMESRVDLMRNATNRKYSNKNILKRTDSMTPSNKTGKQKKRMSEDVLTFLRRNDLNHNTSDATIETSESSVKKMDPPVHFTFSPRDAAIFLSGERQHLEFRRMHNALQMNKVLTTKSHDAELIIINLPAPPAKGTAEENYITYLDALSDGLRRVLFVRGSGKEVVSLYS